MLKANNQLQSVRLRNKLVRTWLAQSKEICVKGVQSVKFSNQNLNKKDERSEGVDAQEQLSDSSWNNVFKVKTNNPFDSANTSEASEVCFRAYHINKQDSADVSDSPSNKSCNMDGEDSIALGHSAMSGRSSTARRKLYTSEKMKKLAALHGKSPHSITRK